MAERGNPLFEQAHELVSPSPPQRSFADIANQLHERRLKKHPKQKLGQRAQALLPVIRKVAAKVVARE